MADGREFARHWMHNGWVTVDGEKMSKSLGNFTSLADLLERSDARAYRLLVLRSHYRSPIEVTPDTIADAEAGLARLDELARRFDLADPLAWPVVDPAPALGRRATVAMTGTDGRAVGRLPRPAMDDDLDTPGALAAVFDLVRRANAAADAGDDGRAPGGRRTPRPCSVPPSGFRCAAGSGTRWTRPAPTWCGGGTRPGPAGTGPGPTRSAASWRRRLGGRGRPRRDPDQRRQ